MTGESQAVALGGLLMPVAKAQAEEASGAAPTRSPPPAPKEAAMKKVTIEHSKLGGADNAVTVPESTAEVLKKSGWKEAPKSRQVDNNA